CPRRPQGPGKFLGRQVTGAGERENAPPLVAGHLNHDVRGRSEPIEAEARGIAGHPQTAVANEAGAQQRRGLEVRVAGRHREAEAMIRDGVLGIPSIELIPGEPGLIAKVLPAREAVPATAAGPSEPGNADAGPDRL